MRLASVRIVGEAIAVAERIDEGQPVAGGVVDGRRAAREGVDFGDGLAAGVVEGFRMSGCPRGNSCRWVRLSSASVTWLLRATMSYQPSSQDYT